MYTRPEVDFQLAEADERECLNRRDRFGDEAIWRTSSPTRVSPLWTTLTPLGPPQGVLHPVRSTITTIVVLRHRAAYSLCGWPTVCVPLFRLSTYYSHHYRACSFDTRAFVHDCARQPLYQPRGCPKSNSGGGGEHGSSSHRDIGFPLFNVGQSQPRLAPLPVPAPASNNSGGLALSSGRSRRRTTMPEE